MKRGSKKIVLLIAILLTALIAAIAAVVINNKPAESQAEFAKVTPQDSTSASVYINTGWGDGNEIGEIVIDGSNYNGYCMNQGGALYGGVHYLFYQGSAYTYTNSWQPGSVKWMLDNILRMNMSQQVVTADELELYKHNLYLIMESYKPGSGAGLDQLSNSQIYLAQQYAFWRFTNNASSIIPSWAYDNGPQANLYNALVQAANSNYGYVSNGQAMPTVTQADNCEIVQDGNDVLVGPITIANSTGKVYRFSYNNLKLNDYTNVKVFKSDKTSEFVNNQVDTYQGNIYIRFYNADISRPGTTYQVSGRINASSYITTASYWSNGPYLQPVATFYRQPRTNYVELNTSLKNNLEPGEYQINVIKTDESGNSFDISENVFEITRNGEVLNSTLSQDNRSLVQSDKVTNVQVGTEDIIEVREVRAPDGYIKYGKTIKFLMTAADNGNGVIEICPTRLWIDGQELPRGAFPLGGTFQYDNGEVELHYARYTGEVRIKIKNKLITGNYKLNIAKTDISGNKGVNGSKFAVNRLALNDENEFVEEEVELAGNESFFETSEMAISSTNVSDIYQIEEETVPAGYQGLDKKIILVVNKKVEGDKYVISDVKVLSLDSNEELDELSLTSENNLVGVANNENRTVTYNSDGKEYSVELSDDSAIIKVFVKNKKIDLALKKTITKVNGTQVASSVGFNTDRFISSSTGITGVNADGVDVTTLKTTTNATYYMNKTPVEVVVGDSVEYAIKIFNEGEVKARASKITDYIPKGLRVTGVKYHNENITSYTYDESKGVLAIDLTENGEFINAFENNTISKDEIIVTCEVLTGAEGILTNVAEISEYMDEDGIIATDIDSTSNNWQAPNNEDKMENTKDSSAWRNYNTDRTANGWSKNFLAQDEGLNGNKGDDDDFDRLIVVKDETVSLTINKVNAEDSTQGINDILFNITKKINDGQVQTQNNVQMTNATITDTQAISGINANTIEYTIQEVKDPQNRYLQLDGTIKLVVETEYGRIIGYKVLYKGLNSQNYTLYTPNVIVQSETITLKSSSGNTFDVSFELSGNSINVVIPNKVIQPAKYALRLRKVSSGNNSPLAGVTFGITDNDGQAVAVNATDANGYTNVIERDITIDNYERTDLFEINEISLGANTGYTALTDKISVDVMKKITESGELKVDNFLITVGNDNHNYIMIDDKVDSGNIYVTDNNGVRYSINASKRIVMGIPTVTITVTNAPDTSVNLKLLKISSADNQPVAGAVFSIYKYGTETLVYNGRVGVQGVEITDKVEAGNRTLEYEITEDSSAVGFSNTLYGRSLKLTLNVVDGAVQTAVVKILDSDKNEVADQSGVSVAVQNDMAVLTIENPPLLRSFDLALKKVITKVDGHEVKANSTMNFPEAFERTTTGKMRIDTEWLRDYGNDAEYYLNKTPIEVLRGSKITYEIRIYNEGVQDATAAQIIDYLPNGMRFDSISYKGQTLTEGTDYTYNANTNTLKINVLGSQELIPAYNQIDDILSMEYVTVECTVLDTAEGILTNVAEISKYEIMNERDERVEAVKDIDSQSANWINNVDRQTAHNETVDRDSGYWVNYTGDLIGDRRNTVEYGQFKNYLGEEDDDDFEKVKVVDIDLVLKKLITQVGNKQESSFSEGTKRLQDKNGEREVITDVRAFNRVNNVTTAEYYLNKTPVTVAIGDTVSYQIRIYNEGSINATASEIKDYIPKGLTFDSIYLADSTTPLTSGYSYDEETNVLTITALKDDFIDKYTGTNVNLADISYKYVTVKCQVTGEVTGILTNVAEISKYQTIYGETTEDRDSETIDDGEWQAPEGSDKNTKNGKSGSSWSNYYSSTRDGEFDNYPGQQDDDDFEKVLVLGYNVKIRKFSDWAVNGLAGSEFSINGNTFITDANGEIDLGWRALDSTPTAAGGFVIEEINVADHIRLEEQISISFTKTIANGIPTISGYTLNIGSNSYTVDISESRTNLFWVNGERLVINVEKDSSGCYYFEIQINNRHNKLPYDLYIRKVDNTEDSNPINGSRFEITPLDVVLDYETSGPWGIGRTNSFEANENGTVKVGRFLLNKNERFVQQDELSDIFKIEEVEGPSGYLKIADDQDIYLIVNKKATQDEKGNYTGLIVDNIKLVLNRQTIAERETEAGRRVVLENVALEKAGEYVDIVADLTNVADLENIRIVPTITLTVQNKQKEFDLALRKYILKVQDKEISRWNVPEIDISSLLQGTTATYNNVKDPVEVHLRDTVLYGISIYNEGERDGYAELVMDDVPEGLEMIAPGDGTNETSTLNSEYRWKMYREAKTGDQNVVEFDGKSYVETTDASEAKVIVTDYLSKEQGELKLAEGSTGVNPNLMKAFDANTMTTPQSREVRVEFKVKSTNNENDIITNKAQIIKHADKDGNIVIIDRDSTPNNWEEPPRDDDQDIEHLVVLRDKLYDLALRKFITSVNGEKIENSREPQVDCTKLIAGGHDAEYYHTKEPILVNTNDVVQYTLRVYNEGKDDAYANAIIDDIPANAEMVAPDYSDGKANNLNAEYRWKMYREMKDGESSDNIETLTYGGKTYALTNVASEAVIIKTDYLSRKLDAENNLIKAFNRTIGRMTAQNYRDVKVEFKIKETEPNKFVINYAQIYEMLGEEGQEVTDIDSTPGVWIDGEDDQDIEVVRVGKFDLALYKWVTQAVVIENENVTEYNSEHTQMDKSKVVNVTIPKDKLNDVTVKFKYQIKVENEGTIPGKALEVKDHIPEGLKFVAEDNTEFGWKVVDDQTVTTDYLKDTVLQPGESAEVTIVLTWINGAKNFGEKVNFAEISKDYNEFGWPDIDSTPDNFNEIPREDDEDSDLVLLQIRTGMESAVYVAIAAVAIMIVAGGVVAIKKFVVNK